MSCQRRGHHSRDRTGTILPPGTWDLQPLLLGEVSISGDPEGLFLCRGMAMPCLLPPQSQTQSLGWWDGTWDQAAEGRVFRAKPVFLRQGGLSWLGRELRGCCSAYSLLPRSEGFKEHQWDHSCWSSPEPSSVLNIPTKPLKPPRGY